MIIDQRTGLPAKRYKGKPRPACCVTHHDPKTHQSAGFDNRGYQKFVCRFCLRLIGYRPQDTAKENERKSTQAMEPDE